MQKPDETFKVNENTNFTRWMKKIDGEVRNDNTSLADINIYTCCIIDDHQISAEVPSDTSEANRKIRGKVKVYLNSIICRLPDEIKMNCITFDGKPNLLEMAANALDSRMMRIVIRNLYLGLFPQALRIPAIYKRLFGLKYDEGENILSYVMRVAQINEMIIDVTEGDKKHYNAMSNMLLGQCYIAFKDSSNIVLQQIMMTCNEELTLKGYLKEAMVRHGQCERSNIIKSSPTKVPVPAYVSDVVNNTPQASQGIGKGHRGGRGGRGAGRNEAAVSSEQTPAEANCSLCTTKRPWLKHPHLASRCFVNPANTEIYDEGQAKRAEEILAERKSSEEESPSKRRKNA